MKNKYNIAIILLAVGAFFMFHSNMEKETNPGEHTKPVFFDRMPARAKKARQIINVDIDYEKLPARNEIRLIGRVNADHLPTDILDYKWTLAKNVKLKSGSTTGKINLKVSNEVTLDVAILNMNKKIDVKLEASIHAHKVKLGGIKSFTYDPLHEDEEEAQRLEAQNKTQTKTQNKIQSQNLSKEEFLKKELSVTRKVSAQQ